MHQIQFLALGSELLRGFVLETNANWLEQQLSNRAAQVQKVTILPDHFDTVVETIRTTLSQTDTLVICGGLGPTDDDLTREALAKALDLELIFVDAAWNEIQDYFSRKQRAISPSNRKQAYIPKGGAWVHNPCGTAPGIDITVQETRIIVLPGVPSEFKAMIAPALLDDLPQQPYGPLFKCWGIGESQLMDMIRQDHLIPDGVEWGTIAREEGITVHFHASVRQHSQVDQILQQCRQAFGPYLYSEEDLSPIAVLMHTLKNKQLTCGTAESCTGGGLGQMITALPGSSEVFSGGFISYSNAIKKKCLGVDMSILEQHGAVSEACAIAMARGALEKLEVDLAIAITGIAGPGGGTEDKPVGTVHTAVAHRDGRVRHLEKRYWGNRNDVRLRSSYGAAICALELLKA